MDAKSIIFSGLFYLLLLPLAYADQGNTFELDFKLRSQYNLFLEKSDRILFEYGSYNNTIIVDEIKTNTTELDIFLFIERGLHTPDYQFLGKDYEIRLDFDKDGNKEMSIKLVENDLKKGTTNILFKRLDAWDENIVLDLSNWKIEDEEIRKNNVVLYVIGAIIILILVVFIVLNYSSKKRGIYF